MGKIKYTLLFFTMFLIGCAEKKITNQEIDSFIEKYKSTDFSPFVNYTIIIRQKTITETIYLVTNSESNIDNVVCFVYVNRLSNNVKKLKKMDLKLNTKKEDEIKNMINEYQKYNFPYLSVDKNGNFCINPFKIDMKPYILFLKTAQNEDKIKKNFTLFKHYKHNWYIRD
ncbi:hypothetical protein [Flavobacterium sp.]|uniref:hypothetical protein n=1 Tax=Flavobacterium sp. TaxID=239 RepID=UPI002619F796|nr:hypothetical protein [Flavobacterium sp.]